MPMLAELVDAVVGVDTHRDTHEVEIALPTGTPIGTRKIDNDSSGFAELLAWIGARAPGPRVVVSVEGTRASVSGWPAGAAAGLTVIEGEQPNRKARRGKGKSDPIDAHLAVLAALAWMPTGYRYLVPTATVRRCGSCSALATSSAWPPPPRPTGSARCARRGGHERDLARATLTDPVLLALARRREPRQASREQAVRHGEIRRLALAVRRGRARASGQPGPVADHRRPDGSRADRSPRHRRGHRSSSHRLVLPPRTVPKRRRVRRAVGHQPTCRPAAAGQSGTGSTAAATEP